MTDVEKQFPLLKVSEHYSIDRQSFKDALSESIKLEQGLSGAALFLTSSLTFSAIELPATVNHVHGCDDPEGQSAFAELSIKDLDGKEFAILNGRTYCEPYNIWVPRAENNAMIQYGDGPLSLIRAGFFKRDTWDCADFQPMPLLPEANIPELTNA